MHPRRALGLFAERIAGRQLEVPAGARVDVDQHLRKRVQQHRARRQANLVAALGFEGDPPGDGAARAARAPRRLVGEAGDEQRLVAERERRRIVLERLREALLGRGLLLLEADHRLLRRGVGLRAGAAEAREQKLKLVPERLHELPRQPEAQLLPVHGVELQQDAVFRRRVFDVELMEPSSHATIIRMNRRKRRGASAATNVCPPGSG